MKWKKRSWNLPKGEKDEGMKVVNDVNGKIKPTTINKKINKIVIGVKQKWGKKNIRTV